jgi:hypothetical protein
MIVESTTGNLDALTRIPSLRVRFSHPMAWPSPDALMLIAGHATDSLRADAWDGVLSASNTQRRIEARLARDPNDPRVLTLDGVLPLLPDSTVTLLVTSRARGHEDTPLQRPDGGTPRATAVALTIAPASRCGALAYVESASAGEAPEDTARVYLRFDRSVRAEGGTHVAVLVRETGGVVPSRASLDCLGADAMARCAVIEPGERLAANTVYRVRFGVLRARNGARVEEASTAFVTGERRVAPRVRFVGVTICAADEAPLGGLCVRASDRWIEVRAVTDTSAIARLVATPSTGGVPRSAIGTATTQHTVRVYVDRPDTAYALALDAIGSDGRAHDRRTVTLFKTAPQLPTVRISEVVAHPRGNSAQEYVELINDGARPTSLSGLVLAQGASRAELPSLTLAPGARAVVVGAAFDPRGDARAGDPQVAPGAVVVVLRGSVAGSGLRNLGADLRLTDRAGRLLTMVPGAAPGRTPREGVGLVRAERELDDEDPAAWSYDAAGSCTPGAPDRLR